MWLGKVYLSKMPHGEDVDIIKLYSPSFELEGKVSLNEWSSYTNSGPKQKDKPMHEEEIICEWEPIHEEEIICDWEPMIVTLSRRRRKPT